MDTAIVQGFSKVLMSFNRGFICKSAYYQPRVHMIGTVLFSEMSNRTQLPVTKLA